MRAYVTLLSLLVYRSQLTQEPVVRVKFCTADLSVLTLSVLVELHIFGSSHTQKLKI